MTNDSTRQSFGDYLRDMMKDRYTPASLARAAGMDATLLGRWLAGKVQPENIKRRSLEPVAAALGVPVTALMVAAGQLTPSEAEGINESVPPPSSRQQLADNLRSRGFDEAITGTALSQYDEDIRRAWDNAINRAIAERERQGGATA